MSPVPYGTRYPDAARAAFEDALALQGEQERAFWFSATDLRGFEERTETLLQMEAAEVDAYLLRSGRDLLRACAIMARWWRGEDTLVTNGDFYEALRPAADELALRAGQRSLPWPERAARMEEA